MNHFPLFRTFLVDFFILYCKSLYQLLLLVLFYHRETNFNVLLACFHNFLDYVKQASFNVALIIPNEYLNPFAAWDSCAQKHRGSYSWKDDRNNFPPS